jgi:hypothetical protein
MLSDNNTLSDNMFSDNMLSDNMVLSVTCYRFFFLKTSHTHVFCLFVMVFCETKCVCWSPESSDKWVRLERAIQAKFNTNIHTTIISNRNCQQTKTPMHTASKFIWMRLCTVIHAHRRPPSECCRSGSRLTIRAPAPAIPDPNFQIILLLLLI